MSALTRQVGGTHYKDMVMQPVVYTKSNMMGGCEHSIIKYVSRWRTAHGLKDLNKAYHFTEFLLEDPAYCRCLEALRRAFPVPKDAITVEQYTSANGIAGLERMIIAGVSMFNRHGSRKPLEHAQDWLRSLIREEESRAGA